MTINDPTVNRSTFGSTVQSPLLDSTNQDAGFSRREFVGMAAASLLMAGRASGSAESNRRNGIPYRTLGHTGEQVSVIGLGWLSPGSTGRSGRKHTDYSDGNR